MNTKTSNQLYNQWENYWGRDKRHNLTWIGKLMLQSKQKALKEVLQEIKPTTAIDVGCGLGFTLSVFKELGINTIGIDTSKTAIKVCQDKGLKAIQKNLEEVTDRYDFVFSDGILEHFLNFEPYARHLMKISDNYVLIIQTDHGSFLGKTAIYFGELLKGSKNVLEYNYRIKDFVSVFEKHGFKLISEKGFFLGIFKSLLFEKKYNN